MEEKAEYQVESKREIARKRLYRNEKLFIEEYLRCYNGTRAYLKIHPKVTYNSARALAAKLLAKVNVREALDERLREIQLGTDEALKLLADQARGNIASLMDISTVGYSLSLLQKNESGALVPKPETKLIRRIKQKTILYSGKTEGGDREEHTLEIELYSSKEAIDTILKVAGKITDTKVQIDIRNMSDDDLTKYIQTELGKLSAGDSGSPASGDTAPKVG